MLQLLGLNRATNTPVQSGFAVMLVDMQYGFMICMDPKVSEKLIVAQIKVMQQCAANDIPLFVLEYNKSGETLKQLCKEIDKVPRVFRFTKSRNNGFSNPRLQETLADLGIKRLLIMGVNASACVLLTAQSAVHNNIEVITSHEVIANCECIPLTKEDLATRYRDVCTIHATTPSMEELIQQ